MQDAVERELGQLSVTAFVHFLLYMFEFDCAIGRMIHSRASVDFTADGRTESTEIEHTVVNLLEMAYGRQGDRAPGSDAGTLCRPSLFFARLTDAFLQPDDHYDEEKVVAQSVAAFVFNNKARRRCNLEPLDSYVFPVMQMAAATPSFYQVPITQALGEAVAYGTPPPHDTLVRRPQLKGGFEDVSSRRECFQALLALKEAMVAAGHTLQCVCMRTLNSRRSTWPLCARHGQRRRHQH
jgi:hypothetical protein